MDPKRRAEVLYSLVVFLAASWLASCGPKEADPAPVPTANETSATSDALLLATGNSIAPGGWHTCAIIEGGAVKCWGYGNWGQLGLADTSNRGDGAGEMGNLLGYPPLGRPAIALASGEDHTCAILDNNQVKCWGYNAYGALGLGDTNHRGDNPSEMGDNLPTVSLGAGRTALAIAAGAFHTCALLDTHQVKCWGYNGHGELGLGDTNNRGDQAGEMGNNLPAVNLGTGNTAFALSASGYTTCVVLNAIPGPVKCWGYNEHGQLGIGTTDHRGDAFGEMQALPSVNFGGGLNAKAVASSYYHTCALLSDDSVKCWGYNALGELGLGNTSNQLAPISGSGGNVPLGSGRTPIAIAVGQFHSCARLDNNQVKCWGNNTEGELGIDALTNAHRGDAPGEMGDQLPAVFLGSSRSAQALALGQLHTCVVLDTKHAKCWGDNRFGALGQGDTTIRGDSAHPMTNLLSVTVGTRSTKVLSIGALHACAAINTGQVRCWGQNGSGQLGVGDTIQRGDNANEMGVNLPSVDLGGVAASVVAAGSYHTCAIVSGGGVKCWGRNAEGQLGLGDTNNRGDTAGEMGAALPLVQLGSGITAAALAGGAYHTCALFTNGFVKCWGRNAEGQLGQNDTNNRGDNANEMGTSLPFVILGGSGVFATAIAAGTYHSCAILNSGGVKCWGFGGYGQLGQGDGDSRGDSAGEMVALSEIDLGPGLSATGISAGYTHTCARFSNGQLKCWGYNGNGELGLEDTNYRGDGPGEMGASLLPIKLGASLTATSVAAGSAGTCALLSIGQVKCWGSNAYGNLGLGDTNNRGDGPGEMGDTLPTTFLGDRAVKNLLSNADSLSACAVLDTNQIKCWGKNDVGQLGLGDTSSRGDALGEMGNSLPLVDLGPDGQAAQ